MMQSRTNTCGELRLADAGKAVTLVGWMENVREVGSNFAFLVLRDFYGTTQIVVETEQMMKIIKGLNKETTISVTGTSTRLFVRSFGRIITPAMHKTSGTHTEIIRFLCFFRCTIRFSLRRKTSARHSSRFLIIRFPHSLPA